MAPAASLDATTNPARARGLRRARRDRAPCEPVAWTPLPDVVDAVHLLALLTRVRAARVAAGEIAPARLNDVRAFKSAYAELGYLRTLTRKPTGGTIVTSMPQLVRGLARLHPAWKIDGDWFADRDRHQRAVRRRLRDLDAMGLLCWRIGVDVDGEDARTELELRPAPDVTAAELRAAAAALERWRARYGAALNTGSTTGIRNAARRARPLSAGERRRRGIARARARASARRAVSTSNSAPRFATPPMAENCLVEISSYPEESCSVCGDRTGVTRASARAGATDRSAIGAAGTASLTAEGPTASGGFARWDEKALVDRVAARLAARQPVMDLIAVQATARALEVASWTLDRGWPARRLQEAWVVWRMGASYAAEWSAAAAGPLERDDLERLRRAVGRYERYADARPTSFASAGLAALAQIAAIAAARDSKPLTLHYAIRELDQLSRRMRGCATRDDPRRLARAVRLARQRLDAAAVEPAGLRFAFRTAPAARWPAWVALDERGDPLLDDGRLVIRDAFRPRPGYERQPWVAPARDDPAHLEVLRDAHLLAGLWPPLDVDGRAIVAERGTYDVALRRHRARPGGTPAPGDRRAHADPADLELARHSGMALRDAQRLDVDVRDAMLNELRASQRERDAHARQALWTRLTQRDDHALDEDGA